MTEQYFEDFAVGQVFKPNGRVRVDKDEIVAFARSSIRSRFISMKMRRASRSSGGWSRAAGIPPP